MAEKKFEKEGEMSLDVLKEEIVKELAGETGAPSAGDDALYNDAIIHAAAGPVVSGAVRMGEELSGPNRNSGNSMFVGGGPKSNQNSLFVGGGGGGVTKATHTSVPLVPLSYSDKKATAHRRPDIGERSQIASMSLTGASAAGGKPAAPKGLSVSDKAAKMLRIQSLQQELNVVEQEMQKASFDDNSKRAMEAERKGDQRAKRPSGRRSSRNRSANAPPQPPSAPSKQQ